MGDGITETTFLHSPSPESDEVSVEAGYGSTESSEEPHQLTFKVELTDFSILVGPVSLDDHDVFWLKQKIQRQYNELYTKQRDLPMAYTKKIYCVDLKRKISSEERLSDCFSHPKFISKKWVQLLAEMSKEPIEDTTAARGHSRPSSTLAFEITEAANTTERRSEITQSATGATSSNRDDASRQYTVENLRLFYCILRCSLLWKSLSNESRFVKGKRYLSQSMVILVAIFYMYLVIHNPFLIHQEVSFSSSSNNTTSSVVNIYFVVQGLRYLVLYALGMWICKISHIHHVFTKSSLHLAGEENQTQWNEYYAATLIQNTVVTTCKKKIHKSSYILHYQSK
ncbi:uncharacterized protein LOC134194114 isoform X2 [Corticium candelabrum]|uniref:uncharacterized protein LOC134194114 isoform X2 n=1 Tax=Corticium candelabrum TaxID=121492 RepID=UPI002E2764CC|nr:uncharacterized protein LOC134194114 isoform X2 [Corticium candelabrum]